MSDLLYLSSCRCCPVNCVVGGWGSWGFCNAACERSGTRTRTRPITTRQYCGGTGCPTRTSSKACSGPCCARNCVLSSWTAWSKCSSSKFHLWEWQTFREILVVVVVVGLGCQCIWPFVLAWNPLSSLNFLPCILCYIYIAKYIGYHCFQGWKIIVTALLYSWL
jgi:hypothetical protein